MKRGKHVWKCGSCGSKFEKEEMLREHEVAHFTGEQETIVQWKSGTPRGNLYFWAADLLKEKTIAPHLFKKWVCAIVAEELKSRASLDSQLQPRVSLICRAHRMHRKSFVRETVEMLCAQGYTELAVIVSQIRDMRREYMSTLVAP